MDEEDDEDEWVVPAAGWLLGESDCVNRVMERSQYAWCRCAMKLLSLQGEIQLEIL